jgi:hypothetical protein
MEREVMREEIMCRMDVAVARAVVVDGRGAASKGEAVRRGMEAGDTERVPPLALLTVFPTMPIKGWVT